MKKVLVGGAIGCGLLVLVAVVAGVGGLAYLGTVGPDTSVVSGKQVRRAHAETARQLGLLEEGEEIVLFYSDALLDVRDGMYLVTEQNLALYGEDWEETTLVTPLSSIVDLDAEFEDSVWTDSWFTATLADGDMWSFPVSTERGMDHRFHEHIESRMHRPEEVEESP